MTAAARVATESRSATIVVRTGYSARGMKEPVVATAMTRRVTLREVTPDPYQAFCTTCGVLTGAATNDRSDDDTGR